MSRYANTSDLTSRVHDHCDITNLHLHREIDIFE